MKLTFDLIAEARPAGREQLGHVRSQLPCLRIDDLELFLDAQRELTIQQRRCHFQDLAFATTGAGVAVPPEAAAVP